jgi:hypothetical protein
MKENLIFYHSTSHKCKIDELKLMLEFQIRIRLDPDLFDWILILQGVMVVHGAIFHARIPIGIRVVANLPDLRSLILHLWKHCSMDCCFEMTFFRWKKEFVNLSLGLIYYSI